MARAFPVSPPTDFGTEPHTGDWQALRGELVALLDQVEGQYARTASTDPAFAGFAQRMRDLRSQVGESDPADLRREALRSVKRQVDRFSERDEPEPMPPGDNVLQSAIREIRARTQAEPAAPPPAAAGWPQPATERPPAFDELAQSISALSGRLGQLEGEIGAQRGNAAQVREIADQVGQLSQVVELLAGAVGETGQVKRLEAQIAGLAQLVGQGVDVDLGQLTERLDQVAATVDRLADLQVQQIQHVVREAEAAPHKDAESLRSLQAIEAGVRNIYDRIDTLESSVALPPAELERISEMLGQIGARLGSEAARPERLLGLVDALNGRINEIEDKRDVLAGLKGDIDDLREAVLGAIEPRFAAIETQLGELGEQLVSRAADGTGLARLEAQVRQLVARMDQTGEQLSDIAVLQMRAEERALATAAPDLGELVAAAAAQASAAVIERLPQPAPHFAALAEAAADAVAARLPAPPDLPDFNSLSETIAARAAETVTRQVPAPPSPAELEVMVGAAATQAAAAVARHLPAAPSVAELEQLAERAAASALAGFERRDPMPVLPDLNALADLVASRTSEAIGRRPQMPAAQLEVIADIVASRTSEAMARQPQPAPALPEASLAEIEARLGAAMDRHAQRSLPQPGLSEASLAEIEERISRLVDGFLKTRPVDGMPGVREGIDRVEERLAQLEAALVRDAAERRRATEAPPETGAGSAPVAGPRPPVAAGPTARPADGPETLLPPAPVAARGPADAMPRHPDVDAPLKEFGFPDLGPVRAALEAKNGPRRPHPLSTQLTGEDALHFETQPITPEMTVPAGQARRDGEAAVAAPSFDPATVARPPRPESSLEAEASLDVAPPHATPGGEAVSVGSRNTFIEAARRAAQRQGAQPAAGGAESLIGKALSRFQPGGVARRAGAPQDEPVSSSPAGPAGHNRESGRARRSVKAAEIPVPATVVAPVGAADTPVPVAERRAADRESFLVRHRRPILIAASLVAVSFMTLNLVMQRLAAHEGSQVAAPATAGSAGPAAAPTGDAAPARGTAQPGSVSATSTPSRAILSSPAAHTSLAAADSAAPGPRIVPDIDPVTTASIASAGTMNYAAAAPVPPALAAANAAARGLDWASPLLAALHAPAPAAFTSPVKVDLPPANVGPADLRQAAANGDARAQFEIAAIYSEGRAVPQDFTQAAVWYERAAAQGFAPAQYRLGNLYENGKGVAKDFEQARLWYQRAAEAGNRMAMHNLAALYAGGQFGKQDFNAAADWFRQAADRGMKDSQFNLGMLYARGLGVPQNLETSYRWFALAAATGDADAAKARDSVARSLDAEATRRLAAEVAAWKPAEIDLAANFAPIGTWEKDFNPGPAITSKGVVEKVQAALSRLGYDVGTPDGQMGPKTALAIRSFERGTGMTEVGAVNPRLLAVLASQPV